MAKLFYVSEDPKIDPNDICSTRYVVETPEEAFNSWLSDDILKDVLKDYFEEFKEENFVDECVYKAVLEFEKNILKIFYEGVLVATYYAVLIDEDYDGEDYGEDFDEDFDEDYDDEDYDDEDYDDEDYDDEDFDDFDEEEAELDEWYEGMLMR